MIQDREDGIRQIESTIVEVNGIFTDLAQIVHEQGFMIGMSFHLVLGRRSGVEKEAG